MRNDKQVEIGRSISAIRLHIRRLSLALESDRLLLANAQVEIDATLEELDKHIGLLRDSFDDRPTPAINNGSRERS
jgi:hypothetical protein